jgi:hypothetical protein
MNDICEKTVSQLLGMNFFIPSYQRGYRWSEQQVMDLLNDIDAFEPNPNNGEWYCLQPLVVKKMEDSERQERRLDEKDWYEVVDGQQRLATIFLIIHYINEMWVGKQKNKELVLKYQTRQSCVDFLKNICVNGMTENNAGTVNINEDNIDYWHISSAYNVIHEWVMGKGSFDNNDFQSKFKEKTRVLWYEVDNTENSINIFTRLNIGKIPLTNAELVKALFLSKDSIKRIIEKDKHDAKLDKKESELHKEEIKLKQLQIASEWDMIERELNESAFWGFITNAKPENYPTKIQFLLNLSVEKPDKGNEFSTFHYFYERLNKNAISDVWEEVVSNFETVREWFIDHELYHLIGYLINQKEGNYLKTLLDISRAPDQTKTTFKKILHNEIRDSLKKIELDNINYHDNKDLNTVLILFNVLTVKNLKEHSQRFPFAIHKTKGWSLEHIHAQNSQILNTRKQWETWLKDHKAVLEKTDIKNKDLLINQIDTILALDDKQFTQEKFEECSIEIIKFFSDSEGNDDPEEMHGLGNMALISFNDNAALNNSVFAIKRQKILEMDKTGKYIPICTKNVFLKYYNQNANDFTYWSIDDRETYTAKIKEVLHDYLPDNRGGINQ